jgi:large subunit ribosomal protein L18
MDKIRFKQEHRLRRKRRVRKKVYGDQTRPRLSVYRSLRNIYAQIIDDDNGVTLVAANTQMKEAGTSKGGNKEAAEVVGRLVAQKALEVGIRQVRMDRNGFKYHGRMKVLADAARKAGLVF